MKIIKTDSINHLEQTQKNDFLGTVIDRIFYICKEDDNFSTKGKIISINKQLEKLQEKIAKKDKLLEQSEELRKRVESNINDIAASNFQMRAKLLESLGSES